MIEKSTKEVVFGLILILFIICLIVVVTGLYGFIYLGLMLVITVFSVNLFCRKSLTPKTFAVILNTDLIFKILMPTKYKKSIKELEKQENAKKHNKL